MDMNITNDISKPISKEDFFRILNDTGFCILNFKGKDTETRIFKADIKEDQIILAKCNSTDIIQLYNPHDIFRWKAFFCFSARLNDSLYAGDNFTMKLFKFSRYEYES